MQKKKTNKRKTHAHYIRKQVKLRSKTYWRFLRTYTIERTTLITDFHSLYEYAIEEHVEQVVALLDKEKREDQKLLLSSFLDTLNHIPKQHHNRLFSLISKLDSFLSMVELLRLSSSLLLRFDDDQLERFVCFCCTYSEPEQILGALRLENRQAQQFAAKETGEDVFLKIASSLTLYAQAHCNRPVQIEVGETSFTDGVRIFLPARLDNPFPEQEYRIRTALSIGYIEFGTLDMRLQEIEGDWVHPKPTELEIERMFRSFSNSVLAKEIFLLFEDYRIQAHASKKYPGIAILLLEHRKQCTEQFRGSSVVETFLCELANWLSGQIQPHIHDQMIASLDIEGLHTASVYKTVELLQRTYPYAYGLLQKSKSYHTQPHRVSSLQTNKMRHSDRMEQIERERVDNKKQQKQMHFDFEEASDFMDRMTGPSGPKKEPKEEKEERFHPNVYKDAEALDGEWCYPEWDHILQDEKPNFTRVMMLRPSDKKCDFVDKTKALYASDIDKIKRVFSALHPQNRTWKRNLPSGMMLNIDTIIQDQIDIRLGTVDSKPYMTTIKQERSISVAFLIDLSSSTNELVGVFGKRIIDIQKEALVVISEALHSVGDFFSIYGFSGYGRNQVAVYTVKEEREVWDTEVQNRLGNLSWKMENRDGSAIRHVTKLLQKGEGTKKVLFLISDGKPLDCGCPLYHDVYAQEDTRAALVEAKKIGIHPFCITVDELGAEYLPSMYGSSFVVINNPKALPTQLPFLYRRYIQ